MGSARLSCGLKKTGAGTTFADVQAPGSSRRAARRAPRAAFKEITASPRASTGVDDCFSVPNDLALRPSAMSIETWVRIDHNNNPPATNQAVIFMGHGDGTTTPYGAYALEYGNQSERWMGYVGISGQTASALNRVESLTTFPNLPTQWQHVVATYSGFDQRIYIDGIQDGQLTPAPTGPITYTLAHDTDVSIGRFIDTEIRQALAGDLDEVTVYAVPLDMNTVRDRYLRQAMRATISVRACDDPACAGEPFVDFSERDNATLGLPSLSIAASGRYLQYRVTLTSRATERPVVGGVSICGTND